ncbi:aspartate kinase [Croceimicrobium sp.]|uniref:aspartate kinase n=1 Tax=Croceimicrobium sp. TaxID=2828340 RepID=UPI003BA95ED5
MRIFKFGGASVKDAAGVQRVASIVQHFTADDILIVVSAMGKTTNALEDLVKSFLNGKKEDCSKQLKDLKDSHQRIIDELFPQSNEHLTNEVSELFLQLETIVESPAVGSFNQVYDQIVSFGELISTKIVSAYLNFSGFENRWLDARKLIRTDQNYRAGRVNWNLTRRLVLDNVKSGNSYITQGFIGSDDNFNPTTLGREGSDYTASVMAYVLQAEEVTIWKDVPGVLNGDPKVFQGTELLKKISFREAIELAFYGASVIHPKTIQPLQERGVPLRVRSFSDLEQEGTTISEGVNLEPFLPCFIRKSQQQLISLATRDLAFIAEDHLSKIYKLFHEYGLRVNLSQHAATSSSFCVNDDPIATPALLEQLKQSFDVSVIGDLELYTVRHYDNSAVADIQSRGRKLLEQVSTDTYQIVIRI